MVPCEKPKMISFAFSVMKNIVFIFRFRFPVKLVCCIVFGSTLSACCCNMIKLFEKWII